MNLKNYFLTFWVFCFILPLKSQKVEDNVYGLVVKDYIVYQQKLDSLYKPNFKRDSFWVQKTKYCKIDTTGTRISVTTQDILLSQVEMSLKNADMIFISPIYRQKCGLYISVIIKIYGVQPSGITTIGTSLDATVYRVKRNWRTGKYTIQRMPGY